MQTPKIHNPDQTSQPHDGPQFPGHFQLPDPQPPLPFPRSHLQHGGTRTTPAVPSPSPATSLATVKRTPSHKPSSRPSGSSSIAHGHPGSASPLKTMELVPALRPRKRKLPQKEIPVTVAPSLPELTLYTRMLQLETCIDSALARKKIDLEELLKDPLRVSKVLRIYLFNTYANQVEDVAHSTTAEPPPSWTLKITGRILEDGCIPHRSSSLYPKFSSFVKKIAVYLDQNLYPDNHVVLWDRSRSPALHDGFELKRKGDKEFTAIVRLEMDFLPEKLKLGAALQEVLGIEVDTHSRVLQALWHYIKSRKLQVPEDISSFICDPPLRNVFGEEKLKFSAVAQKITDHLSSPKPLHLEHKIKLSGNSPAGNACYDIEVDVPVLLETELTNFLSNLGKTKDVEAFDQSISAATRKLHEHCLRRDFFMAFSQSPAEFINTLLASQARDLKLLGGDTYRNTEKERRSEFYNQPWFEDAIIRYLNRRPSVGSEPSSGSK